MAITFKLEDFEGPLDLLLYLLEKNKMSIYDIEISSITDQYMEYIDRAVDIELEYMSEFIVMASTLLYIKSKMLLPKHTEEENTEEDPREELIRKLLEYKKIKYVSEELDERQNVSLEYGFRNKEIDNDIEIPKPHTGEVLDGVSLEGLYQTFQELLKQKQLLFKEKERKIDHSILQKDSYTIEEKNIYILNLIKIQEKISFFSLFDLSTPKIELIVTFMSILELTHKKQIKIIQEGPLEDIIIIGANEDEKNTA